MTTPIVLVSYDIVLRELVFQNVTSRGELLPFGQPTSTLTLYCCRERRIINTNNDINCHVILTQRKVLQS